ncbi:hypothetical protein BN1195_01185 [Chryseobacterium oranimense G311]|nr:hypothetical protein BN1195_01185 [Chryseobacterium oranimense G311]
MINLIIMAKCLSSICAVNHVTKNNFLYGIIAVPARRALEREKIDSLEKLSDYSEQEIMKLHGFGRNTMQKLKNHMEEHHVSFKS